MVDGQAAQYPMWSTVRSNLSQKNRWNTHLSISFPFRHVHVSSWVAGDISRHTTFYCVYWTISAPHENTELSPHKHSVVNPLQAGNSHTTITKLYTIAIKLPSPTYPTQVCRTHLSAFDKIYSIVPRRLILHLVWFGHSKTMVGGVR